MTNEERDEYINAIHEREREIDELRYDLRRAQRELEDIRDKKLTIAAVIERGPIDIRKAIVDIKQTGTGLVVIVAQ